MFIKNEEYTEEKPKTKRSFVDGYYQLTRDLTCPKGTMTKGSIVKAVEHNGFIKLYDKDNNDITVSLENDADALCKPIEILELEETMNLVDDLSDYDFRKTFPIWSVKKKDEDIIKEENIKYPKLKEIKKLMNKSDKLGNIMLGCIYATIGFFLGCAFFEAIMLIKLPLFLLIPLSIPTLTSVFLCVKWSKLINKYRDMQREWRNDAEKQIFALEDKLSIPELTSDKRESINNYFVGNKPKKNDDILIPKEKVSFNTETETFAGGLSLTRTVKEQ